MQLGQRLWLGEDIRSFQPKSEGMIEEWDGGGVPGATGQRARFESLEIVSEVGDDHFDDFIWDATGRFMSGAGRPMGVPRLRRGVTE